MVWCNGLFLRSWIEYGVPPYPYPFTSRMQRAPIITELHYDLLSGAEVDDGEKRRHLHMPIFRIVAS